MTAVRRIGILYMIPLLYGYAGTEKHLLTLASNIDRAKFVPHVCCFRSTEKIMGAFREKNIGCRQFSMRKIYGWDAIGNLFRMTNYIKMNNITIVQTFHPNADLYGPIVAKVSGVPIVISSRRDLGYNRRNVTLQKRINRLVKVMIAPSNTVKQFTMEHECVPESKLRVIYNGVDSEYFKPEADKSVRRREIGLHDTDFVVTTVANFKKIKGVDIFLRAAAPIAQHISESRFIIIGDGRDRESLKQLASDLGILNRILFTGNISNVRDYLSASDVYLSSSRSEGFSNSILEAMAMGIPVVATDVGGNKEAIVEGESGFLVPPSDFNCLAAMTVRLYRDGNLRAAMKLKSRKRAVEQFSIKQMVGEHERLYELLSEESAV